MKLTYQCLAGLGSIAIVIAVLMLDLSMLLGGLLVIAVGGIGLTLLEILEEIRSVKLPKKSKNPNPYLSYLEDNPLPPKERD